MGSAYNSTWGAPFPIPAVSAVTLTSTTLSTLNTKVGAVMALGCTGTSATITHVGYRQGTSVGTPASNSYKIGIQGISSAGVPDGTYLGGGSPASKTFTPAGANDNAWVWVALDNSVSVNRDTRIGLVIERVAATDAGNCILVASQHSSLSVRNGIPYGLTHNATSWTKITGDGSTGSHMMGCKSASEIFGHVATNLYALNAFGSTTESGMFFTVPSTFWDTYKVKGVRFLGTTPPTGANTHVVSLYSSPVTGSVTLIAQSNQTDNDSVTVDGSQSRSFEIYFTGTLPTLTAGTEYGIGVATTTASGMELATMAVASAADLDAWSGGQQTGFMTRTLTDYPPSGNDSNNFTKTATKRPLMELILDDITAPSGGGSTVYVGGVTF
jgi:hypothetical protein